MIDQLKNSTLLNNYRILLICLFILLAGLSAGLFSGSIIESSDKLYLASVLENRLSSGASSADSSVLSLLPALLTNTGLLLLIFAAGLSVYGSPFAMLILLIRTFASGFCTSLLLYILNDTGILKLLMTFFLPNILLCSVYLLAAIACLNYALPLFHTGGSRSDRKKEYILLFALLAVITFLASMLQ